MKKIVINENDAGQRMDKFITKTFPSIPFSLLYKYLRLKRIKLNGKRAAPGDKLIRGDVIELYINDELLDTQKEYTFLNAPAVLDIVYEDEHILIVDKKAQLVCHESEDETNDTLINRIQHYLYEKGSYHPEEEQSFAPALCNRIDRNTSGLVIAAKTALALRILNEKIKNREITKLYLCLVIGALTPKQGRLSAYHKKDEKNNLALISDTPKPGYKEMITEYKVLSQNDRYSLVEVDLKTGRTHQIRAHFAHIGHPLLGDGKYGNNRTNREAGFAYQALHSYKLIFSFQTSAEELSYLKGEVFTAKKIWFAEEFKQGKI